MFPSFANQPRENKRGEEGKGSRSLSCFGRGLNRGRVIFLALRARVPFRGRRRGADIISLAAVSFLLLFFACLLVWIMGNLVDARLVRSKCTIKVVFRGVFLEIEINKN